MRVPTVKPRDLLLPEAEAAAVEVAAGAQAAEAAAGLRRPRRVRAEAIPWAQCTEGGKLVEEFTETESGKDHRKQAAVCKPPFNSVGSREPRWCSRSSTA
jgi:hypothetical protein